MYKRSFPPKKRREEDECKESLLVFGYASRLYPLKENHDEQYNNEEHLIPWHGDETLKIDRYDCRLYLHNLTDFEENAQKAIESVDVCPTERMEEEMCDEERYKDLHIAEKRAQEAAEEEKMKRQRGAAIGFSYEGTSASKAESSSSEEEVDEPYAVPEGLKLPVGLELPKSLKLSTIIDKTATFVVKQGPQMEIVIRAKQRKNADQFGFLEFDHILNPYYKYICKLIREEKYTPVFKPLKKRPKQKKIMRLAQEKARQEREVSTNGERPKNALEAIAEMHGTDSEGTSDEDSGYLHPLLMGGNKSEEQGSASPMGPMPRPPKEKTPEPDLLSMIKRDYTLGKVICTSDFLPKKEADVKKEAQKHERVSRFEPETAPTTSINEELILETNEEAIRSYDEWHMTFYERNSPFYPNPPPVIVPPPPSYLRAVQAAASYVAQHGPSSEQILLDHNEGGIEFMIPSSRYYTFYQAQVRFHHYQVLKNTYEYQQMEEKNQQVSHSPDAIEKNERPDRRRLGKKASRFDVGEPKIVDPMRKNESLLPEKPKISHDPWTSSKTNETDPTQNERKERARLFMERILKDKAAAKNQLDKDKKEVSKHHVEDVFKSDDDESNDDRDQEEIERAIVIKERQKPPLEQATVYRELQPDAISTLINKTIEKALPGLTTMVQQKSPSIEKDSRSKKDRKEKHRSKKHRRRLSSASSDKDRKRRRRRSRDRVSRSRSSSRSSHSNYGSARKARKRSTSRSKR